MRESSTYIDDYRKIPLPTDHLKINKYNEPDNPFYVAIYPLIVDITQKALRVIQDRLKRKQVKRANLSKLILL